MAEPHSLTDNVKTARVSNAVVAGTSTVTSSTLDTLGFAAARFLVAFGVITAGAVTSVKVQQSSDDGASDGYSDIAGSGVTVADTDDNSLVAVQIFKPQKRYLKCIVLRATQNAVVDGIVGELYRANQDPVTQDTTLSHHVELSNPAEGTP